MSHKNHFAILQKGVLLGLVLLVCANCASTRTVHLDQEKDKAYRRLVQNARDHHATLHLIGDLRVKAKALQVTPDSTSWIDPETGQVREIATDQIQSISFLLRRHGAEQGLGMGLVGGALIGLSWGLLHEHQPCSTYLPWPCFTREQETTLVGGGLGLISGIYGSVLGGIMGSRRTYVISRDLNEEIER